MTTANQAYDVFVNYSRADGRQAAEIDSFLRENGLKSFFDRRNLAPGLPWVRALEQAINAAKAVIVVIGPRGLATPSNTSATSPLSARRAIQPSRSCR